MTAKQYVIVQQVIKSLMKTSEKPISIADIQHIANAQLDSNQQLTRAKVVRIIADLVSVKNRK